MTTRQAEDSATLAASVEPSLPVPDLTRLDAIGDMLSVLASDEPLAVVANAYVAGRRLALALTRALRPVTARLQVELEAIQSDTDPRGRERHKPFRAGPLRLSWKAIDPKWVCNAPERWSDPVIQGALADLEAIPEMRRFVARVPAHYEILTQSVGLGMTEGDPAARLLFDQAVDKGWRTVEGRAAAIDVVDS